MGRRSIINALGPYIPILLVFAVLLGRVVSHAMTTPQVHVSDYVSIVVLWIPVEMIAVLVIGVSLIVAWDKGVSIATMLSLSMLGGFICLVLPLASWYSLLTIPVALLGAYRWHAEVSKRDWTKVSPTLRYTLWMFYAALPVVGGVLLY